MNFEEDFQLHQYLTAEFDYLDRQRDFEAQDGLTLSAPSTRAGVFVCKSVCQILNDATQDLCRLAVMSEEKSCDLGGQLLM